MSPAVLAGIVSTAMFVGSSLPMVVRAWRTRDLTSYSRSHLVLANVGNLVHSVYIVSLPFGPAWMLHGFHVTVTLTMLVWHLRYVRPDGRESPRWQPAPTGSA
jgi:hypothetical protein